MQPRSPTAEEPATLQSRVEESDGATTSANLTIAGLAHRPDGDVLMLNLSGAAADGVGAMAVGHAIARAYGGERGPGSALDFLAGHDLPVRPVAPPRPLLSRSSKRAVEWLRDKLARTGRIAPGGPTARHGYGYHMVSLSARETEHAVRGTVAGTERNALMAALHLAIGEWNLEHGAPGRRIGVLAPANLRPSPWPRAAIDTTMLCDPGWMDEAPSFGHDAGDTAELWFSAPARSPLSLCLGAVTVGGRLHLTFRYPHRLFGPDVARRFADCHLGHVRAVADSRC